MTVSEAVRFFGAHAEVIQRLRPLVEVGLDYLRLGQPVPTLSGGEAQRLKLAGHLAEAAGRSIAALPRRPSETGRPRAGGGPIPSRVFLFGEPTTGPPFDAL